MTQSDPQKNPGDFQTAYIAVGSNMGRRRENCCRGIEALAAAQGCRLVETAPCYRTAPVGYLDQDWFVNTMVKIETVLEPSDLLSLLKSIENEVGRRPSGVRFGPRVLDMDILIYGDRIVGEPGLTVPHPRMHERRFVLVPFCDIDPGIVHPVLGEEMWVLLGRLGKEQQEVEPFPCDC